MAELQLSLSYANPNSGPSANRIGWINWGNFAITQGETDSVTIPLPNGQVITFDVTNTIAAGDGLTILSDVPLLNSAFGTLGYTNIPGNIALEAFDDYQACTGNSSTLTLSNISVKDSLGRSIKSYSFVLASIQVANGSGPLVGPQEVQTFTTSGRRWRQLIWLGNTSSPVVNEITPKSISIYPVSSNSGSPVYTTNSPKEISVNISGCNLIPQFAIGIIINPIEKRKISAPTRGANLFKNSSI